MQLHQAAVLGNGLGNKVIADGEAQKNSEKAEAKAEAEADETASVEASRSGEGRSA